MGTSTSEAVIQVADLRKEYGTTTAVDGVTFDIFDGEGFGLLGPNGAGKTTLVEILQGLRTPTAGDVTVLGLDLEHHQYEIKDRIGVVPQSFHTFERLTVRENVALMHDLYSDPLAVDEVLDQLDFEEWAGKPFHALSGGYQRRTGIAMALVSDPDVLFLDEPTTGLDPAARRTTWEQIDRLPDLGTTVVLTTHYMDEIEHLADRAALLVDGRVEALDTVPALVEAYAGDVKVVVRLPADANEEAVATLESTLAETAREVYRDGSNDLIGVFEDRHTAQAAFSDLHDAAPDRSIDLVSAGMEDVFLALAGRTLDEAGELR